MRSVQPVLGPGVSESLERTRPVCVPAVKNSVTPFHRRGPEAKGEKRAAVSGWTFVFFREKREEPSLLSVTWAIRFNGRVTRGTG